MSEFERCIAAGELVVFPSDTVYGIACDPDNRFAVQRLYLLKRRPLSKPSAVMWFGLEPALEALPWLGQSTLGALRRLLPGQVTLLLHNPVGVFAPACGSDPGTLGVRVPAVRSLAGVRVPVLQSSANFAAGPDPRSLDEVPVLLREAAELVIDGGSLPGTPSTVVDLRGYEQSGEWAVVRQGAVSEAEVGEALGEGGGLGEDQGLSAGQALGGPGQFHFDPATYPAMIRNDISFFEEFQDRVVDASGAGARRILELGTGTGETARRLLARHPAATLSGVDASDGMLAVARAALPAARVQLKVGDIASRLPDGPFDLVVSALCVHHLDADAKADLFERVFAALAPGGRFVLGDVIVPDDPEDAVTSLTPDFDKPDRVDDQLRWLQAAGFQARMSWAHRDLAVIVADRP